MKICKCGTPLTDGTFYRSKPSSCKTCFKATCAIRRDRYRQQPPRSEHRCSQCRVVKAAANFYRAPNAASGLTAYCRECLSERNQAPERRDKYRQYRAKRAADVRTWIYAWMDRNREKVRAYDRVNHHVRRARANATGGRFTVEEWVALCEFYGHKCLGCGERKPLTADHVVPLSKGGSNTIENIQPLCGSCNFKKHVQTVDYRLGLGGFDIGKFMALLNQGTVQSVL